MSLSTSLRRMLAGLALICALALAPQPARAQLDQQCYVSGSFGMDFGEVSRAGGRSASMLDIVCRAPQTHALFFTVCVFIGSGNQGEINPRLMHDYNQHFLKYDLFSDFDLQHMLDAPENLTEASVYRVHVYSPANTSVHAEAEIHGWVYPYQAVPPGNYQEQNHSGLLSYLWDTADYPEFANCSGGASEGFDSSGVKARFADSCIVSASDLDFGSVDTLGQPVLQTSSIRVDCPVGKEWSLGLDNGQNGPSGSRHMENGDHHVSYQLYRNAERTLEWGDTGDGDRYHGSTDANATPVTVTVYGRVPVQDDVPPGRYTDTVIATLYY